MFGLVFVFTGMFSQFLYLPSTTVVKTEGLEEGFFRSFFLILHFQSLRIMSQFLFKSRVGGETWLKIFAEIFRWDTVKRGIFRAKVDLRIYVCLNRTKPWLELNIKFNQYSIRPFQKALVGFNNL